MSATTELQKQIQVIVAKAVSEALKNQSGISMLQRGSEASEKYEVINMLFSADKNIDLISEIHKPRALAVLSSIRDYCISYELPFSSSILENFRIYYLRNMMSAGRRSREEAVEILKSDDELDDEIMD